MDINLSFSQRQSLSYAQIQSLDILSFDSEQLNQFLRDEYLENPLLDYTEKFPDITKRDMVFPYSKAHSSEYTPDEVPDLPRLDDDSIKEILLQQLNITHYSKYEWSLFKYLIDCLDENGYFHFSPEDIHKQTGAKVETISMCLDILRQLEPIGIFSYDLSDCLISQLDKDCDGYDILKKLILNHMEDMALGKISSISRAMNLSTASVRKYMDRIRVLNPKPLSNFLPSREHYVIPDIIYIYDGNSWNISLNDDWIENYHLNDYYLTLLETTEDPDLISYFEKKLAHIQLIFSYIEQRRKTLFSIAEQILIRQKTFFLSQGPLRPMTMTVLSKTLGIHLSTVSRALKGKYVQAPRGTILCKDLFTPTVITSENEDGSSQNEIKLLIRKFIDAENKEKPYSDHALEKLLKTEGISVSRRAIAKYRHELGIGSSVDRKE